MHLLILWFALRLLDLSELVADCLNQEKLWLKLCKICVLDPQLEGAKQTKNGSLAMF